MIIYKSNDINVNNVIWIIKKKSNKIIISIDNS